MRINRQLFLSQLESASPGLSPRALVEQSSCFVIGDGKVQTYNEEVSCSVITELQLDTPVAVQAFPLMAVLQKMEEETIEVATSDSELLIMGRRRRIGIRAEYEIVLPIHLVERPTKKQWKPLPPSFTEAIEMVQSCAGRDENAFITTCLHITPNAIEATDDYQIGRYSIELPIDAPILVRRSSVNCLASMAVTHIATTSKWAHFRNKKAVVSCRQFEGDYPNVMKVIKMAKGDAASFPKALAEAAERAAIFSQENAEHGQVMVELLEGTLRISGEGFSGWYKETRKTNYSGAHVKFLIDPKLLIDIVKRYEEYEIGNQLIKVDGGEFVYVTVVGDPDASNDPENEE